MYRNANYFLYWAVNDITHFNNNIVIVWTYWKHDWLVKKNIVLFKLLNEGRLNDKDTLKLSCGWFPLNHVVHFQEICVFWLLCTFTFAVLVIT